MRKRPRKRPLRHHRAEITTSVPKNTAEIDRSQQRAENYTSVPKNIIHRIDFLRVFPCATKNTNSVPPKSRENIIFCDAWRLAVERLNKLQGSQNKIREMALWPHFFEKKKLSDRSLKPLSHHPSHTPQFCLSMTQPPALLLIQLNNHAVSGGNHDGSSREGVGRLMQRWHKTSQGREEYFWQNHFVMLVSFLCTFFLWNCVD